MYKDVTRTQSVFGLSAIRFIIAEVRATQFYRRILPSKNRMRSPEDDPLE